MAVDYGVTERKIGKILRDLVPDEEKEGINGDIVRRWFYHKVVKHITSKQTAKIGGKGVLDLESERARLAKQQADAQEIKNALSRGEIISTAEATAGVGKVASAIVTILESIPIRLKRANPALTQADLDIVRTEIAKARNECAVLLP